MPGSEAVAFGPRPLSDAERKAALSGVGEIGAAAHIYLDLIAAHRVHTEKTGSTEAQKVASISKQYQHIPRINPVVAMSVLRFVSLGIKGLEPKLPKPPPFVVMFALAMVNKSLGLVGAVGGNKMTAEEFVVTWGLGEWLKQSPDVRVSHEEFTNLIRSERQRTRAKKPRRKRLVSRYLDDPSTFSISDVGVDGEVTITDRVSGKSTTVQWDSIEHARRRKQPGQ
jgi:hypothetical protein